MSNNTRHLARLYNALKSHQVATVGEYRRILERTFKSAGVSEEQSSADLILAAAIGRKTLSGISPETTLTHDVLSHIQDMTAKRIEHQPLQYIIGEWDFCSLTFSMQQPVFIPRPETEELVGLALTDPCVRSGKNFLEIGSGSGVISTVLLKLLLQATCTAIDVNPKACLLTKQNAMRHNVANRLSVVNCTWRDFLESSQCRAVDFIISNPPYVPTDEMNHLQPEIAWFEDRRALHGGMDGMDTIRDILTGAQHILEPGGSLWLEVDYKHPDMIKDFVDRNKQCNLKYESSHKDFTGRLRFCRLSVER